MPTRHGPSGPPLHDPPGLPLHSPPEPPPGPPGLPRHDPALPLDTPPAVPRHGPPSGPPRRDPAGSARLVVAAGLVWLGPTRLLVQRRPPTARHGAGALELPGGKVEPGEAPRDALRRELIEEWGAAAGALPIGAVAEVLHHIYPPPGPEVLLLVYHVDAAAWRSGAWESAIRLEPEAAVLAFDLAALPLDEFLAADREFIARVQAGEFRPSA